MGHLTHFSSGFIRYEVEFNECWIEPLKLHRLPLWLCWPLYFVGAALSQKSDCNLCSETENLISTEEQRLCRVWIVLLLLEMSQKIGSFWSRRDFIGSPISVRILCKHRKRQAIQSVWRKLTDLDILEQNIAKYLTYKNTGRLKVRLSLLQGNHARKGFLHKANNDHNT